jgi:hypothetical protein
VLAGDWLVRFDESVFQASLEGTFRGGLEFGVPCSSLGGVHDVSVAEEN